MDISPSVPNYQRIIIALREEINQGTYTPGQSFITQQEVSRRFGVSRITADRALNELVREGLLERRRGRGTFVVERTKRADHSLVEGGIITIACIISINPTEHITGIMRSIENICRENGCHVLYFDSCESAEIEAENLQRALKANVNGIILYPVNDWTNSHLIEKIYQSIPIVMVDRYYPTLAISSVVFDNIAIGYEVTAELLRQGHTHIGTVWLEVACTSTIERLLGYRRAFQERGMAVNADLAALRAYNNWPDEQRLNLLKRWLESDYHPTAIIAANGPSLAQVARDLTQLGLPVAQDIVLATMDHDDLGIAHLHRALKMHVPSSELGVTAMKLLLERIWKPTQHPQQIVAPTSFLVTKAPVPPANKEGVKGDE
ncbi:GntR family transcriptional regulator [Ktedonobacteria bacterium brp13]|nr:GntR family transcriptional regulator [Ktedonobacteria bacterium brp13]